LDVVDAIPAGFFEWYTTPNGTSRINLDTDTDIGTETAIASRL
jgi:hypothetical protein